MVPAPHAERRSSVNRIGPCLTVATEDPAEEEEPVFQVAASQPSRLEGEAVDPFQAGPLEDAGGPADPAGREVERGADLDADRHPKVAVMRDRSSALPSVVRGRRRGDPGGRSGSGRARPRAPPRKGCRARAIRPRRLEARGNGLVNSPTPAPQHRARLRAGRRDSPGPPPGEAARRSGPSRPLAPAAASRFFGPSRPGACRRPG